MVTVADISGRPLSIQEPFRPLHGGVRLPQPAPADRARRSTRLWRRRPARLSERVGNFVMATPGECAQGRRAAGDHRSHHLRIRRRAGDSDARVMPTLRSLPRVLVEITAGACPRGATEPERSFAIRSALPVRPRSSRPTPRSSSGLSVGACVSSSDTWRRPRWRRAQSIDSPVRRSDGAVTYDGEALDMDRGRALGLAIDIGTTTVVVELVDLESGHPWPASARSRTRRAFGGSDVMNRISYDERRPGRAAPGPFAGPEPGDPGPLPRFGVDRRVIYEAFVVGNATMRDIFFGIDVSPIGQRPYKSTIEIDGLAGASDTTVLRERAHRLGGLDASAGIRRQRAAHRQPRWGGRRRGLGRDRRRGGSGAGCWSTSARTPRSS